MMRVVKGVQFIFLQDSAVWLQLGEEWLRLFFPVDDATDGSYRKPVFYESIDNFLEGYLGLDSF